MRLESNALGEVINSWNQLYETAAETAYHYMF